MSKDSFTQYREPIIIATDSETDSVVTNEMSLSNVNDTIKNAMNKVFDRSTMQGEHSANTQQRSTAPSEVSDEAFETLSPKEAIELIKEFDGKNIGVEPFIASIEDVRSQVERPDYLRRLVIAKRIVGNAARELQEYETDSYEKLYEGLRILFGNLQPVGVWRDKRARMFQGKNEAVAKFTNRFLEVQNQVLAVLANSTADETRRRFVIEYEREQGLEQYLLGLRKDISTEVRAQRPNNIRAAIAHAQAAEAYDYTREMMTRNLNLNDRNSGTHPRPSSSSTKPSAAALSNQRTQVICNYCRKANHTEEVCRKKIWDTQRESERSTIATVDGFSRTPTYPSTAATSEPRASGADRDGGRESIPRVHAIGSDKRVVKLPMRDLRGSGRFLLDTGSAISLIKRGKLRGTSLVDKKINTEFCMGNDKHKSLFITQQEYQGQKHIFHVIPDDFPLDEDGLIGIPFMEKYQTYIGIGKDNFLEFDGKRLKFEPLTVTVPARSIYWIKTRTNIESGSAVTAEDNPAFIVPCVYKARNHEARVPIVNDSEEPMRITVDLLRGISLEESTPSPSEERQDATPDVARIYHVKEENSAERIRALKENVRLEHVPPEMAEQVWDIVSSYPDVFALPGDPLPGTKTVKHRIITSDDVPINVKQYRYPPAHKEEIDRQVTDMLDKNLIEPSDSPYNSPLWVVPKKTDASGKKKWRIVIDFRKLNEKTSHDAYPLPCIDEILDQLGRAKYFSAFDLASGFHQIPMDERDKHKTAFSTPSGHYHYNRMPFGLKNAPPTFQRMMNNALRGLIGNACFVYLDDIIIYGNTLEEHNKKLIDVLNRLRQSDLKLQPDKCEFLRPELEFLGHVISEEGVKPNPKKIEAVKNFPAPLNAKQIKQFLGLAGYYRKFIKDFSKIAKPLTELLKKDIDWYWTEKQEQAFDLLRTALTTAPVLQYPDFTQSFVVTTDASNYAVGAVLSQGPIGKDRPVAYASRTLNKAEQRYSTTEREMLAIQWAAKHFRQYLYGKHFQIVTDHKPLIWILKATDPPTNSRLMRLRMKLEEYEYEPIYKKGSLNTNADALSRIHAVTTRGQQRATEQDENIVGTGNNLNNDASEESQDGTLEDETPLYLEFEVTKEIPYVPEISERSPPKKVRSLKITDVSKDGEDTLHIDFSEEEIDWFNRLATGMTEINEPTGIFLGCAYLSIHPAVKSKIKQMINFIWSKKSNRPPLYIYDSELYEPGTEDERLAVIQQHHGTKATGHFGVAKTLDRIKTVATWPNMQRDIEDYVRTCDTCQRVKLVRVRPQAEAVITDTPERPNDKIALDLVGPIPESSDGYKYIMSVQDQLTKYITLIPLKTMDAQATVNALVRHFIYIHGAPKIILTDGGRNFISQTFKHLEKLFKINHMTTTAFHPQSNGSLERAHGPIKEQIKALIRDDREDWNKKLKFVSMAYNTAKHEGTSLTPFEMQFGRKPNIPNNLPIHRTNVTIDQYFEGLRADHNRILKKGREHLVEAKERYKTMQDANIHRSSPVFSKGDEVLVDQERDKSPLAERWEGPAIVLNRTSDVDYEILLRNRKKLIHVNKLKPYFRN